MKDQLSTRIWRIAWPAVLEMALYMIIGIVDVAFVGRLGAVPLAAVSLGAEFFFGVIITLTSLAIGATVLTAHYTGSGNRQKVDHVAGQILIMALIIGVVTGVLGWFLSPKVIAMFNLDSAVASIAVQYMRITFIVAPLALCWYMGNGVFRGTGRTRVPMTIALISNIFNVFGDYVLIFGKWGFPELGGAGAAWATAIAHVLGFGLLVMAMTSGRWGVKVNPKNLLTPDWRTMARILKLGIPAGVEELLRNASIIISSFFLVNLGTAAFAAHQIAITVESVSYMPGFGFAVAATAVVGQSLGAGRLEHAKGAAYKAFRFAVSIMGIAGLLFLLIPEIIAALFTNNAELIRLSSIAIRIAAFEQVTIAAEMVFAGALRGAGDTRSPMLVALFGIWFFRLPMLWLLVNRLHLGLGWVWMLFVVDWALRSLVIFVIFRRFQWQRAKLISPH